MHPKHEDVDHLLLDYGDLGVRASIQVSWLSPQKVRRVTAVGTKKMAAYDDLAADERIRVYDKSAVPPEGDDGRCGGSPSTSATWSPRSCRSPSRWPSRIRTSSTASPTAPGHPPTATAALTLFRYSSAPRYQCASSGQSSGPTSPRSGQPSPPSGSSSD